MNYYLSGQKDSNCAWVRLQDRHVTTIFYSRTKGFEPKGCVSLNISLMEGSVHSATQLVELLNAVPKSVKKLTLPWHDGAIPHNDYVAVLRAVPTWVTELNFSASSSLSVSDNAIMSYIPDSCKALWGNAFIDIQKAADLVLLLGALPSSINEIALSANKLKEYSQQELSVISTAIPVTVKLLRFNREFGEHIVTPSDLARIFRCISPSIEYLRCSLPEFSDDVYSSIEDYTNGAELALRTIPASVTNFELFFPTNIPHDVSIKLHKRLLQAVPKTVSNLSVYNFLDGIAAQISTSALWSMNAMTDALSTLMFSSALLADTAEIIAALQAIPRSVRKLELKVIHFSINNLTAMLRLLPESISEIVLDFSGCRYSKSAGSSRTTSVSEIVLLLQVLPASVKKLKIAQYLQNFWHPELITADDLLSLYAAVPATIRNFDIGYRNYPYRNDTTHEYRTLINAWPRSRGTVMHLGFGKNFFTPRVFTQDEIVACVQSTPTFIATLSLRLFPQSVLHNTISDISLQNKIRLLQRTFRAMPNSVMDLDLRKNYLFHLGVEHIITVLNSLPANIDSVDLRDNYFQAVDVGDEYVGGNFSAHELARILRETPNIARIYMNYEDACKIKANMAEEDGVFVGLDLRYDYTTECFTKLLLDRNRARLEKISSMCDRQMPSIIMQKIGSFLPYATLAKTLLASSSENEIAAISAANRLMMKLE